MARALAGLERIARRLRRIERDMGELLRDLPPGDDDMVEGSKPYDRAFELRTALECLLADKIRPAVELTARLRRDDL